MRFLGLFEFYIDHLHYQLADLISLREISLLMNIQDFFVGSVYENLIINHHDVGHEQVYSMLKEVHLIEKIHSLPNGINEKIFMWDKVFDDIELVWLLIIRLKIIRPRLAVLNHILDSIDDEEIAEVVAHLTTIEHTTLLVVSNQSRLTKFFEQFSEL